MSRLSEQDKSALENLRCELSSMDNRNLLNGLMAASFNRNFAPGTNPGYAAERVSIFYNEVLTRMGNHND